MSEEKSPRKGLLWFWIVLLAIGVGIVMNLGYMVGGSDNARYSKFAFRDTIRAKLKDPGSAKFSDDQVYEWEKGSFASCGYVNAKNSFGGYTGKVRFVSSGPVTLLENEDAAGGGIFDALHEKVCHDA